jgi:hypothetical protein
MIGSSYNRVLNQFIIETPRGTYFQSYKTVIAFKPKNGPIILSRKWDYSSTTGKYRNIFLKEKINVTREKLLTGEYKKVDKIEIK